MMSKRKLYKPSLPDPLNDPIEVELQLPSILLEGSLEAADKKMDDEVSKMREMVRKTTQTRFEILAKHYNCDIGTHEGCYLLAFQLACDFIDGFKTVEKTSRGPKKKWNAAALYVLWYEVNQLVKKDNSAWNACRLLMKKEPWSKMVSPTNLKNGDPNSLYKNYIAAKKSSFVRFIQNAQAVLKTEEQRLDVSSGMYEELKRCLSARKLSDN